MNRKLHNLLFLLLSISMLTNCSNKGEQGDNAVTDNIENPIDTLSGYLKFNEVSFQLMDARLNKCVMLLGGADKVGYLYVGDENKIACVYLNKVVDDGKLKHLVLFLRSIYRVQKPMVEEVYAVGDNEKAYYGIHSVWIKDNKIFSNSPTFYD